MMIALGRSTSGRTYLEQMLEGLILFCRFYCQMKISLATRSVEAGTTTEIRFGTGECHDLSRLVPSTFQFIPNGQQRCSISRVFEALRDKPNLARRSCHCTRNGRAGQGGSTYPLRINVMTPEVLWPMGVSPLYSSKCSSQFIVQKQTVLTLLSGSHGAIPGIRKTTTRCGNEADRPDEAASSGEIQLKQSDAYTRRMIWLWPFFKLDELN
ncbi:hypothetical protein J3D48_006303 [Pseudomonas fluorescens]|uniref:hypothetical protein n=1 Tax=Pseudomonas fluorescens TaxID=294 RepID=UPI0020A1F1B1|nr:hypothetical protein [Pseudomonas fluorescens]MCP1489893.1 hypothetical protein [Pseudomonas fluorescens]